MAKWCLTKTAEEALLEALRKDGDPQKMVDRGSDGRREFFTKYVGEENAKQINALFESKLLLKNQVKGFENFIKRVGGPAEIKKDLMSKVERLDKALSKAEVDQYLEDYTSKRIGIEITEQEYKVVSDLVAKIDELKALTNEKGEFKSQTDRWEYGANKVALEKYVNDLKLKARHVSFKERPAKAVIEAVKESGGTFKSLVASLDNSFFGRQGIKTLYKSPKIWANAFARSWVDIARELKGKDAMDIIRADIYSRPNAVNGKYEAGDYGLNVLSEEAYPSSLPEKIPVLGRFFKASESAYNGGALRMRADLADNYIKLAEEQGLDMTNPKEARPLGQLISSLTGRGSLLKAEVLAKEINIFLFSAKFLKSNYDTLVAPVKYAAQKTGQKLNAFEFKSKGEEFASKEAAKATLRIIGSIAGILAIAKFINPDSVEEDPRSANFGKIKIFGHWTDITGGMGGLVVLASRLIPTTHDGKWSFWSKSADGTYKDLHGGKYGQQTALDIWENYWEGKGSPPAGVVRDVWKGTNFQGQPNTVGSISSNATTPLSIQTYGNLAKDPASSNVFGSLILDMLGYSVSTAPQSNSKSKQIKEGVKTSNSNVIDEVILYANAAGTDPETAFNRFMTGQKIVKVSNGTVIVERMSQKDSQAIKKAGNADNPTMKLDHTIPLELGGSNDKSNLKLVTTTQHRSYTAVENALGRALKSGRINKATAQKLILGLKRGEIERQAILDKYK